MLVPFVCLWDAKTGKRLRRLAAPSGGIGLAFSADGRTLAAGRWDGGISLWRVDTGEALGPPGGDLTPVNVVAFAGDGKTLATGGDDRALRLWDAATGKELRRLDGPRGGAGPVALAGGERLLSAWVAGGEIHVRDGGTGKEVGRLAWARNTASAAAAFSPDGRRLAAWEYDRLVRLWDVTAGRELRTLAGPHGFRSAAFSPDGRRVATTDLDGSTVRVWDVATGKELRRCDGHRAEGWGVVFSPDGRSLLSPGNDQTVRLWEVATGAERWRHKLPVDRAAFSPDGKLLATAFHNHLTLRDAATGKELCRLPGHQNAIRSLAFSPDGRRLASGSADATALVWDVAGALVRREPR